MKKWFLVMASVLIASCGYSPIYNGKEPYAGSRFMLMENPRHTMDFFVESMTDELVVTNTSISARTPIAVTSFVDLQHLDATSWLGTQCQKRLSTSFSNEDFKWWTLKRQVQSG